MQDNLPYHRYPQLVDFLSIHLQRLLGPLNTIQTFSLFGGLFSGMALVYLLALVRLLPAALVPVLAILLPLGGAGGGIWLTWLIQGQPIYERLAQRWAYRLRRWLTPTHCQIDSADLYSAPPPPVTAVQIWVEGRPAVTYSGAPPTEYETEGDADDAAP